MSLDLSGAPACVQAMAGATQQQARDVIRLHLFLYYVEVKPSLTDKEYDCLEWYFRYLYPSDAVINGVGSCLRMDYPGYTQEGRRPFSFEVC